MEFWNIYFTEPLQEKTITSKAQALIQKVFEMDLPAIIKEEWLDVKAEIEDYIYNADVIVKDEASESYQDDWCVQNVLVDVKRELTTDLENNNIHKCSYCTFFFNNRMSLYHHNLTHLKILLTKQKFYRCDECLVYFRTKDQLNEHNQRKHAKNLTNHEHTESEQIQCEICLKSFNYKHWHGHMTSVHGTPSYKCLKCGKTFKCAIYLKRHIMHTHERVKRYAPKIETNFCCDYCSKTFKIKHLLSLHIQNCHGNAVKCKICNSKLGSEKYLRQHMSRVHYNDGKIHKCPICKAQFKSPRYVRVHVKNVHNKKTLTCKNCNEIFFGTMKILENHMMKCLVEKS